MTHHNSTVHPSFGLVGRVRIGADGLHRITVQDAPSVRRAVPRLRSQIVDDGLARLNAPLGETEIKHVRATLWAEIVARGMVASDADSRDRRALLQMHAGGMGLLLELGWPNVFIIEESSMVFHFRRIEGSAVEASQRIETQIREYLASCGK